MEYPYVISVKVKEVFGDEDVKITLHTGLTTFVGTNASGKTKTLKALRDSLKSKKEKVRYLSSNRIGTMEVYRSRADKYSRAVDDYSLGDLNEKKIRHEIETANGDFFTMDEQKDVFIKVAERLSVLFKRHIFIRWDAGKMKVFFGKTGSEEEYSVAAEASGLVNVISILAALFDESIEVLLIDEPEVSLHPQLQSYLLREIKNVSVKYNKAVIMATHSAEMIDFSSVDDMKNFVFFSEGERPKQISENAAELKDKKLQEFLLRMGLIYKEGFFAKKVLLIEGASDMIVCRYLCNRFDLNLDVAGTQIIPVEGKGQFPIITKLFRLIGKDVCILTDLDGFTDDCNVINLFSTLPIAVEIANESGNKDLQSIIREIKNDITAFVSKSQSALAPIYQKHPYWLNRDPNAEKDIFTRRAIIAQLLSTEDLTQWPDSRNWERLKTRIGALLDILEQLGCFVLRKGAIESYYIIAPNTTYDEKPSAAILEVGGLEDKSKEELYGQYSDLIRALEFAAIDKLVDESFAVKKELLSELALVLGILHQVSTENELVSNIKQQKGDGKSLFCYKIIQEGDRKGVEVSLTSQIIEIEGFPFNAFETDNVNQIVNSTIHPIS